MQLINDLNDLLAYQVRNLFAAEEQVSQAMPAIIDKVNHRSLKNALSHHLGLTAEQKGRLEKIGKALAKRGAAAERKKDNFFDPGFICKGIAGLVDEANEVVESDLSEEVVDSAIISCVQKLEHYEISSYGSALAFAVQLKLHDVELLLRETLDEEYDADDLLTSLATSALNKEAAHMTGEEEPESDQEKGEGRTDATTASRTPRVSISERTISSPGGRSGTSHRGYGSGESRGH